MADEIRHLSPAAGQGGGFHPPYDPPLNRSVARHDRLRRLQNVVVLRRSGPNRAVRGASRRGESCGSSRNTRKRAGLEKSDLFRIARFAAAVSSTPHAGRRRRPACAKPSFDGLRIRAASLPPSPGSGPGPLRRAKEGRRRQDGFARRVSFRAKPLPAFPPDQVRGKSGAKPGTMQGPRKHAVFKPRDFRAPARRVHPRSAYRRRARRRRVDLLFF